MNMHLSARPLSRPAADSGRQKGPHTTDSDGSHVYYPLVRVLVTGGAGFIGSHQVVALAEAGHEPLVIDDLSNSDRRVMTQLEKMTGRVVPFGHFDVRDRDALRFFLKEEQAEAVMHFAAKKHVWESVDDPIRYYDVNLGALTSLLDVMSDVGLRNLIFSSSGSVYGIADRLPIPEDEPLRPTNPYSATKAWGERILRDVCEADPRWSVIALRYFNPAGAHPSGLLGENPTDPRSNLLPVLMAVASGELQELLINGVDFDTVDGSGVRDYVHVMDVARAHVSALERVTNKHGFEAFNIGRGHGVSVFQLIAAVEQVTGVAIPRRIAPRRPGDVAALYADTSLASQHLGCVEYADLDAICADAWRWQRANRTGRRS